MSFVSPDSARTVFITLILLLPAVGAVLALYNGMSLRRFVRKTRMIRDMADLARFQKMVARQMHAALVQLVVLTTPMALYMFGILTERLRIGDILFVIVPAVVPIAIGSFFKKVETQACRIPAVNADLDEQRLAVIKRWRTRALPDW